MGSQVTATPEGLDIHLRMWGSVGHRDFSQLEDDGVGCVGVHDSIENAALCHYCFHYLLHHHCVANEEDIGPK